MLPRLVIYSNIFSEDISLAVRCTHSIVSEIDSNAQLFTGEKHAIACW